MGGEEGAWNMEILEVRGNEPRGGSTVCPVCVWSASDRLDTYIHWGAAQLPLSLSLFIVPPIPLAQSAAALFVLP